MFPLHKRYQQTSMSQEIHEIYILMLSTLPARHRLAESFRIGVMFAANGMNRPMAGKTPVGAVAFSTAHATELCFACCGSITRRRGRTLAWHINLLLFPTFNQLDELYFLFHSGRLSFSCEFIVWLHFQLTLYHTVHYSGVSRDF
jgi:hypothetical protein